jgi:ANTAR domain-containing protein
MEVLGVVSSRFAMTTGSPVKREPIENPPPGVSSSAAAPARSGQAEGDTRGKDHPVATPGEAGAEGRRAIFAAAAKADGHLRREEGQTLVVIGADDSELVERATALGIAYQLVDAETLEEAIALVLKESQELERLRTLTPRLAQVERAKGILMERHKLSERDAYEQMRNHARSLNLKLTAVAEAVESSYFLLPLEEA